MANFFFFLLSRPLDFAFASSAAASLDIGGGNPRNSFEAACPKQKIVCSPQTHAGGGREKERLTG